MTAIKTDQNFLVQDPRNFDGDPYQVAERAIQQLAGIVNVALAQIEPVTLMVRNADLERTLAMGDTLGDVAAEWPESPQGRSLAKVQADLEGAQFTLGLLAKAAAFNPKAR